MAYIFAADSMVLSSFNFLWWAPKYASFWNRMRIGRSRSSKVVDFGTNRKGVCDFLLVINSNIGSCLAPFLRYCELLAENCEIFLPHPCLTLPFMENPSEFLDETYRAKTRGMGLLTTVWRKLRDPNFNRFWLTHPCDGQTDGRNCDSICAISMYAVARNNWRVSCKRRSLCTVVNFGKTHLKFHNEIRNFLLKRRLGLHANDRKYGVLSGGCPVA